LGRFAQQRADAAAIQLVRDPRQVGQHGGVMER
jgi:hypothetical protein